MSYASFLNRKAVIYRKTTETGKAVEDWVEMARCNCMVESISPSEILTDDLRRLKVDYRVYVSPGASIDDGDKLLVNNYNLIVKRVDDIALMNRVIVCWVTKI